MNVFSKLRVIHAGPFPIRLAGLVLGLPALLCLVGCNRATEPTRAAQVDDREAVADSDATQDRTRPSEPGVSSEKQSEGPEQPAVAMKPAVSSEKEAEVPEPAASKEPTPEPEPLEDPPETLGIGDVNPGLHVAKWIKGDPVEGPLTGKVHVVEFWATWCGPCRVGMPHISELQSEYGDEIAFIGVTRENESKVQNFLTSSAPNGKSWDEVIQYRLAIDDRNWTNTAYMRAAGQSGIPCAFVVGRDGVVEWIGHPGRIDEPLEKIVEGNWDRAAAIAEYKQQQRLKEASRELSQLARAGEWDRALELLDEIEQETGESITLLKYRLRLLQGAGKAEEASETRSKLIELAWEDPNALNEVAWTTATGGNVSDTDLRLALKAAERASELRDDQDPAILDTLARCHYELGDLDEAIKWQRRAVEENGGRYRQIDATLERYQQEKEAESGEEEPLR